MERILAQYKVYSATVTIKDIDGVGLYLVQEPYLNPELKKTVEKLAKSLLKLKVNVTYDRVLRMVSETKVEGDPELLSYYVFKRVKYGDLTIPIYDEKVERVEYYGLGIPIKVVHTTFKNYLRLTTNLIFVDQKEVEDLQHRLNFRTDGGYAESYTPEGHKVIEYRSEGSFQLEVIKRFSTTPSVSKVCKELRCNFDALAYLWEGIEQGGLYVIGGNLNATKALVNSILSLSRMDLKIVTVESSPKLNFEGRNWSRVNARVSSEDLLNFLVTSQPDVVLADMRLNLLKSLLSCPCSVVLFTDLRSVRDIMGSITCYLGKRYKRLFLARFSGIAIYDKDLRVYSVDKLRRKTVVRRVSLSPKALALHNKGGSNDIIIRLHNRREFLERVVEDNVSDEIQIRQILREYLGK
ncbi:MAG: hypothetical protein MPF33_07605 [Candidatus Aramenus sp.]|nr:hypothetical protein [Candidatus Aramenus sp.]